MRMNNATDTNRKQKSVRNPKSEQSLDRVNADADPITRLITAKASHWVAFYI